MHTSSTSSFYQSWCCLTATSRVVLLKHTAWLTSAQIGIDWTVDMADVRKRLGHDIAVQGNIDPTLLFASQMCMLPIGVPLVCSLLLILLQPMPCHAFAGCDRARRAT
eukprot:1156831-Pelagomonas_calceolata.AAC.1